MIWWVCRPINCRFYTMEPTRLQKRVRKEVIRVERFTGGQGVQGRSYVDPYACRYGKTVFLPGVNIAPALSTLSLSKQGAAFEFDSKKNGDLLFTFPRLIEAKLVHELRRPL